MKVRSSMNSSNSLLHNMHRSSTVDRRNASPRKKEKLTRTNNISPTWGDATPGPMAITFGTLGDLVSVINRSSFGINWFTGFRSFLYFVYLIGTDGKAV